MSRPTTPTSEFFSNFEAFLKKFKITSENDKDQEILTLANLDSGRIRKFIVKKVDERSLFGRRSSQKKAKDENENKAKKKARKEKQLSKPDSNRRFSSSSLTSLKSTCSLKFFSRSKSLRSTRNSSNKKKKKKRFVKNKSFDVRHDTSTDSEIDDVFSSQNSEMTASDQEDGTKNQNFRNKGLINDDFEDEGVELGKDESSINMEVKKLDDEEDGSENVSETSLDSSPTGSPRFNLKMSPVPTRKPKSERNHSPVSFRSGYQSNRSSISSVRKGILKKTNSSTTINMEMSSLSRPETPTENGTANESGDETYSNEDAERFARTKDNPHLHHQRSFNRVKFILDSGRPDNITGDYDDIKMEKNDKSDRNEKLKSSDKTDTAGLSSSGRKCLGFSAGLLLLTMAVILGSFFGSRKSGVSPKALSNVALNFNKHIGSALEGKFKILNENFVPSLYEHESAEFRKISSSLQDVMMTALFADAPIIKGNSTVKLKIVKYEKGSIIAVFRLKWEGPPTMKLPEMRKRITKHLVKYGAFGEYKVDKDSFTVSELRDLCEGNPQSCSHICYLNEETLRFGCTCPDNLILMNNTHCISPKLTSTTARNKVLIPNIINKVLKANNAALLAVNQETVSKGQPSSVTVEKPPTSQEEKTKEEPEVTSEASSIKPTTNATVETKASSPDVVPSLNTTDATTKAMDSSSTSTKSPSVDIQTISSTEMPTKNETNQTTSTEMSNVINSNETIAQNTTILESNKTVNIKESTTIISEITPKESLEIIVSKTSNESGTIENNITKTEDSITVTTDIISKSTTTSLKDTTIVPIPMNSSTTEISSTLPSHTEELPNTDNLNDKNNQTTASDTDKITKSGQHVEDSLGNITRTTETSSVTTSIDKTTETVRNNTELSLSTNSTSEKETMHINDPTEQTNQTEKLEDSKVIPVEAENETHLTIPSSVESETTPLPEVDVIEHLTPNSETKISTTEANLHKNVTMTTITPVQKTETIVKINQNIDEYSTLEKTSVSSITDIIKLNNGQLPGNDSSLENARNETIKNLDTNPNEKNETTESTTIKEQKAITKSTDSLQEFNTTEATSSTSRQSISTSKESTTKKVVTIQFIPLEATSTKLPSSTGFMEINNTSSIPQDSFGENVTSTHQISSTSDPSVSQPEEIHSADITVERPLPENNKTISKTTDVPQNVSSVSTSTTSSISTTPESTCSAEEFQCLDRTCVDVARRCDSVNDCDDGSDEKKCVENKCLDNYQCRWSGECLSRRFVCDGVRHCTDGDDEENCETWKCAANEFRCTEGGTSTCIPLTRKCDGHPDCFNRTDELNCTTECPKDSFLCPEGSCIPNLWKCDGSPDCLGGEDEQECDCEGLDQSPCVVGGCVPTFKLCDGLRQCPDGSDEWGCLKIDNKTKELQVRSIGSLWSAVCGNKWTSKWSDLVCEQLGAGVSLSTEVKRVTQSVLKPRVQLSPDAPEVNRIGRAPLQYFLTPGKCPGDPLVHVSCKPHECGHWNMSKTDSGSRIDTSPTDVWPSMGLLIQPEMYSNSATVYSNSCAGTVITMTWIVTSYSCLSVKENGLEAEKWAFLIGEGIPKAGDGRTQLRYGKQMVVYPGVKRKNSLWEGDVVLLRLQTALSFTATVQPICLSEDPINSHDNCVIGSWKRMKIPEKDDPKKFASQTIQTLPVPNLTANTCNTSYYKGFLTNSHTCASFVQDKGSPCTGNEGSPLMCRKGKGSWQLHGLLSNIGHCGSFTLPSVFTDLSYINEWLLNTIGRSVNGKRAPTTTSTAKSTTTKSSTTISTTPMSNISVDPEIVLTKDDAGLKSSKVEEDSSKRESKHQENVEVNMTPKVSSTTESKSLDLGNIP